MADPRLRRHRRRDNRATPARQRGAAPARDAGSVQAEGNEADPASDVLLHHDMGTQAGVLRSADGATRERATLRLQQEYGNAYVSRVVQREPTPGSGQTATPPTPTSARAGGQGTTWLQPFPSTVPRISMPPTESSKTLHRYATGHPYIGNVPVASAQDAVQIQEANEYFEGNPLQPWERSSGEHLQKRNKITDLFQRKAYELTLYTLEQSETHARGEQFRYDEDNPAGELEARHLREASHHLGQVQQALLGLINNPVAGGYNQINKTANPTTKNLDDFLAHPKLAPKTQIKDWGWLGAGQVVITEEQSKQSNDAIDKLPGAMAEYKALRDVYASSFPILLGANQDYSMLADMPMVGDLHKYAYAQTRDVEKNIAEARKELKPEKIWSLPIVIEQTKQLLGITEGTGANDAIQGKLDDIAIDSAFRKIAMAGLQIGVQIVGAMLTGGLSVAVQVAGAAVSAYAVHEEWEEYSFQKAMTGRVSLDSAKRLAQGEPGYGWLAFDIASTVFDIGAAAAAFRNVLKSLKAADALGDATKAAKAIEAVTSTTDASSSVLTMAQVEEIVRAQAVALRQQGKLAVGMSEELFVERIMSGLRRQVAGQGAIAEHQAGVVARVLNGTHPQSTSLMLGEPDALMALLTEHGEWKSLVTALERGGKVDIAKNLVEQRAAVVKEITAEIKGLSKEPVPAQVKPMGGGSKELVSDVDLQISGADAGQMMIEAEAYMGRRFGQNWSQMFRLNFYTEGKRLTTYYEVLSALKPMERVAMTKRITAQVEKFNFARMLMHAGDDPAAIARVELMAKGLGIDLEELRPLAALDDATRTANRYKLSQEVDALQAEYRKATGARRVELGEQITSKQMEANFYTHEANIAPGSMGFSGVAGLEMQEAYQGGLTYLEMIEHILAASGGDVVRASREYELFKYVHRFGEVAEKAGKDSAKLKYLRNQGEVVAKGNREMMEETAHEYLEASKVHNTLPQHTGATPPVTDDFLVKHFEMFEKEAADTLARLNPQAARRAPAAPRSARTTAPMPAVRAVDVASESGVPRLINHSTGERYLMVDAANPRLSATGKLEEGGELSITIRTKLDGQRSQVLRGEQEFQAILQHFEGKVTGIRGAWSYGDNLARFNELTAAGKSAEEAALGTWTGQQAVRAGFTRVTMRPSEGTAGAYTKVNCLFHR